MFYFYNILLLKNGWEVKTGHNKTVDVDHVEWNGQGYINITDGVENINYESLISYCLKNIYYKDIKSPLYFIQTYITWKNKQRKIEEMKMRLEKKFSKILWIYEFESEKNKTKWRKDVIIKSLVALERKVVHFFFLYVCDLCVMPHIFFFKSS